MGKSFAVFFVAIILAGIAYSFIFNSSGVGISSVETSIAQQFKQQWKKRREYPDSRYIKDVKLGKFYISGGTNNPYVEVTVFWSDSTGFTAAPVVRLGDSVFAISYEVPQTHQNLSAIGQLDK